MDSRVASMYIRSRNSSFVKEVFNSAAPLAIFKVLSKLIARGKSVSAKYSHMM